MPEPWKTLLEPFGMMVAGIEARIEDLSDDELAALRLACAQPTQTNCWCFTYQASRLISPMVENETQRRLHTEASRAARA